MTNIGNLHLVSFKLNQITIGLRDLKQTFIRSFSAIQNPKVAAADHRNFILSSLAFLHIHIFLLKTPTLEPHLVVSSSEPPLELIPSEKYQLEASFQALFLQGISMAGLDLSWTRVV